MTYTFTEEYFSINNKYKYINKAYTTQILRIAKSRF